VDIAKRLQERMDDAVELAKQQPNHANLDTRINDYLADKLTAAQMKELSDAFGPQIDAEILRREQAAQRKKELDEKNALRIFDGVFTDKEEAAARKACAEYAPRHPSILGIVKNQLMLLEEVWRRKQFVTVPNLDSAYKFLDSQGAFEKPIEPIQSATEFKAANIQDWPEERGIPPLVRQRIEKLLDTFCTNHAEYIRSDSNAQKIMAALPPGAVSLQGIEEAFQAVRGKLDLNDSVQRGELVTVTNMGGHPHGFPKESEKYSLKMKVRSMSADQIAQRCADDPAFEAALNFPK
jgi:hypothetical protein